MILNFIRNNYFNKTLKIKHLSLADFMMVHEKIFSTHIIFRISF